MMMYDRMVRVSDCGREVLGGFGLMDNGSWRWGHGQLFC